LTCQPSLVPTAVGQDKLFPSNGANLVLQTALFGLTSCLCKRGDSGGIIRLEHTLIDTFLAMTAEGVRRMIQRGSVILLSSLVALAFLGQVGMLKKSPQIRARLVKSLGGDVTVSL
jgi:hypothetical protein